MYKYEHMVKLVYLLKRAGEVAALSFKPSDDGFIVNTTCRLFIICTNALLHINSNSEQHCQKIYNTNAALKL